MTITSVVVLAFVKTYGVPNVRLVMITVFLWTSRPLAMLLSRLGRLVTRTAAKQVSGGATTVADRL